MTKIVDDAYVVASDETVSDTDEPAFLLVPGGPTDAPQLTNYGAIDVARVAGSKLLVAVQIDSHLDSAQVQNKAGGLIEVSSSVQDGEIEAVNFKSDGVLSNAGEIEVASKGAAAGLVGKHTLQVQNDGDLIVHARHSATGIFFEASGELNNTGTIVVTSRLHDTGATGVAFAGDASLDNSGLIKARGGEGADGVLMTGSVSHFENSGRIAVSEPSDAEGYATGVQIYTVADGTPVDIENTGVIDAPFAIHGGDADGVTIHNSGRVLGTVDFESSDQQEVFNSGRIKGGVYLGGGEDLYDGTGGKVDAVSTGSGDDTALGGTGAERLGGEDGADRLLGRGGADTLTGGEGADLLSGGKGADHFAYFDITDSAATAPDVIKDLDNSDTIDLSGIDTDRHTRGDQGFTLVDHLDGHAAEAALVYDAAAGMTRLELDADGDGQADAVVLINGDHREFTNFIL